MILDRRVAGDRFITVSGLCRQLGMSRQNYYKEKRKRKTKSINEKLILELIKQERHLQPMLGGRKLLNRLHKELTSETISMGRDRFFDLLRKHRLLIRKKPNNARTTNSDHGFRTYGNVFKDCIPKSPGDAWVSDITYIRTNEGFIYLSLITDAFSRKIIGYDSGDSLEATGCMKSLKQALGQLANEKNPIHHSDRGSQYCCKDYIQLLKERKIQISMTEANHCYENAMAERINGILKHEYGLKQEFKTKAQAKTAIKQSIQLYNEFRPHYKLDMRTPAEVHSLAA